MVEEVLGGGGGGGSKIACLIVRFFSKIASVILCFVCKHLRCQVTLYQTEKLL